MRHATLESGGRDSAKTGEGGWASWTAQALFAWTRTHDEPGKSGTFGYIAADLLCADVSFTHRALARFWAVGAKASHGNNHLLDACFRVFARCAKRKFQLFHFVQPLKMVHLLSFCKAVALPANCAQPFSESSEDTLNFVFFFFATPSFTAKSIFQAKISLDIFIL